MPDSTTKLGLVARHAVEMMTVLDIPNLKHAIKLCLQDIVKQYPKGDELKEALRRVSAFEAIILKLECATPSGNLTNCPNDITALWKALDDCLTEYPDHLRSEEEEKLVCLVLKGVYELKEVALDGCKGLRWEKESLPSVLCAGFSWLHACIQKFEPKTPSCSTTITRNTQGKMESKRKEKLKFIASTWYNLFKRILNAQVSPVETRSSRRIYFTVVACLADSIEYSADNALAIIDGQTAITNKDFGFWLRQAKSFLVLKSLADIFVNLNLNASDPARWSQEAFVDGVWEKRVAKGFRNLLGHRLGNPDQGRLKLLDLIVDARFPQFRTHRIKTIHIGETKEDLGLVTSLFIDGSSMTWQTAQKLPNGSIIRDTPLTDCYFANGKHLQLSEEGVLTVFLVQDDTTVPLDASVTVRIQLEKDGGGADLQALLRTRGAQVNANPPAKQSISREHANMSIEEQNTAIRNKGVANHWSSVDKRTALRRDTPIRVDVSVERKAVDLPAGHIGGKQDLGFLSHATEPCKPKTMRQGKSSKPQSDLKSFCVDSPPKQKGPSQERPSGLSSLQPSQGIIESQTLHGIQMHQSHRNTSGSLTPLTSQGEDSEVNRNRNTVTDERQKQIANMRSSATGPTPRTYGQARKVPVNELSRKTGNKQEQSSVFVVSNSASRIKLKRKADCRSESSAESKKSRTASALDSAMANLERSQPVQNDSKSAPFERDFETQAVARRSTRHGYSVAFDKKTPTETVAINCKSGEAELDTETSLRPRHVAVQQKNGRTCHKKPIERAPKTAPARSPPSERPVKQTPKVQEDLFYVQPAESSAIHESPPLQPDSASRQTGCSMGQRDVRFSSPLDSHQPKHAAETTKKSSLKKGTAASSAPDRTQADSSNGSEVLASVKGLIVVVDPPSTVAKSSSEHLPRPNILADNRSTLDSLSSRAPEVSVTSEALPVESTAIPTEDVQPGSLSLSHLRKASIDRTLQMPSHVKATNYATQKLAEDPELAQEITGVVSRKDTIPAKIDQKEEEQDRRSLPKPVQKRKRASTSTKPVEATEQTESPKKRRGVEGEFDTASPAAIRVPKSVSKPTTKSVQREAEHGSKDNRLVLLKDCDEDGLTEEALDIRELVMKIYKMTWQATQDTMQAPIRDCSLAQERLAEHVAAVLRDALAETQQIVDLWNESRERCYETIAEKIQPAVLKLEEENDRAFARFQDVGETWSGRRLRVPRQILDWTQE